MNHKAFWEKYIALTSDDESRAFLKNYLFSLPPAEMKKWLLSEAQSIIADLKKQLNDLSINETWKTDIKDQLEKVAWNVEYVANLSLPRKAA